MPSVSTLTLGKEFSLPSANIKMLGKASTLGIFCRPLGLANAVGTLLSAHF